MDKYQGNNTLCSPLEKLKHFKLYILFGKFDLNISEFHK